MGNRILFAALACAATTALATNTVNPTFLWDGSADTTGRVITGSPEATSGYWFSYNDANDHGTSRFQFPPEFDMDTYDGFSFGLMAESFGGIKATVVLGEGAEKPHVGLGFNIWNEDQKGVDITAWGGICLEYSSGVDFKIVIGVENENTVTAHEDFSKTVGKADSLKVVDYEWRRLLLEEDRFARTMLRQYRRHQAGRQSPGERVAFGPHGELRRSGAFCQGFRGEPLGPGREVRDSIGCHGLERPPGRHLHAPRAGAKRELHTKDYSEIIV